MTTPAPTPCRAINGCFAGMLLMLALAAISALLLVWAIRKLLDNVP